MMNPYAYAPSPSPPSSARLSPSSYVSFHEAKRNGSIASSPYTPPTSADASLDTGAPIFRPQGYTLHESGGVLHTLISSNYESLRPRAEEIRREVNQPKYLTSYLPLLNAYLSLPHHYDGISAEEFAKRLRFMREVLGTYPDALDRYGHSPLYYFLRHSKHIPLGFTKTDFLQAIGATPALPGVVADCVRLLVDRLDLDALEWFVDCPGVIDAITPRSNLIGRLFTEPAMQHPPRADFERVLAFLLFVLKQPITVGNTTILHFCNTRGWYSRAILSLLDAAPPPSSRPLSASDAAFAAVAVPPWLANNTYPQSLPVGATDPMRSFHTRSTPAAAARPANSAYYHP
jgi:hypothetical protein